MNGFNLLEFIEHIKFFTKKIVNKQSPCVLHNKPKEIGDRVIIWNESYNKDIDSGKYYPITHQIFQYPFIVIKKNCTNLHSDSLGNEINRDLLVYSPKFKRRIATLTDYVKLLE